MSIVSLMLEKMHWLESKNCGILRLFCAFLSHFARVFNNWYSFYYVNMLMHGLILFCSLAQTNANKIAAVGFSVLFLY